jgi:GTP-binding protein Era
MTDEFRAGFVTVVGRPNVGKSTLVNCLLGQKVAAVSPRPQTTRRKQLGILTNEQAQVIFMDTPGLHKPVHKLGEYMNAIAALTLQDADLILWLVAVDEDPTEEDRLVAEKLAALQPSPPVFLLLNKADLLKQAVVQERGQLYAALLPAAQVFRISATTRIGVDALLTAIIDRLPVSEPYYDEEQITDLYEREIAADLIREAALLSLREEIPHAIAVRVDEYKERSEEMVYVAATLFVERESHKGIVIGQGGAMLKAIGMHARQQIEEMAGRKVFLELRVKVNKNWRNEAGALRLLGYSLPEEE